MYLKVMQKPVVLDLCCCFSWIIVFSILIVLIIDKYILFLAFLVFHMLHKCFLKFITYFMFHFVYHICLYRNFFFFYVSNTSVILRPLSFQ